MTSISTKKENSRKKAALACIKKLQSAADAVDEYLRACRACGDGSGDHNKGISDSRQVLIRDMTEYAGFLNFKYDADMEM